MIKVLLIESDPKTRDIIRVGLDQFQSFDVDQVEDSWGVEMAKEKRYDLVFVDVELSDADGVAVAKSIRESDEKCEIILITKGKSSRLLSKEKAAQNIFALLSTPIAEEAFFKLISRAKDRIEQKGGR